MKFFTTSLFIFFCSIAFSQVKDAKTRIVDGKKFYVHTVESGNTLWGIHRLYDVPVDEIVANNPAVAQGLKEGQELLIPIPVVAQKLEHEVLNGETLFGISRKYGVTVGELLNWNPEAENGLKAGQKLIINKEVTRDELQGENSVVEDKESEVQTETEKVDYQISFNDSVVEHVVGDKETLYSISKRFMVPVEKLKEFNGLKSNRIKPGETIKIPLKKERIEPVEVRKVPDPIDMRKIDSTLLFPKKAFYNVALLLPFYLDKGAGYSAYVSELSTEFYMGASLALDSLEKMGLKAKIHVFDTKNDMESVQAILNKSEFKSMDIVIGPLFDETSSLVADWCKVNGVRMICPVGVNTKLLEDNPYVYAAVPSDITLMKGLARNLVQQSPGDRFVLIKPTLGADSVLYQTLRDEMMLLAKDKKLNIIETNLSGFTSYLTPSMRVQLIFPTTEKKSAVKFYNELGRFGHKTSDRNTFVVGTKEWVNFDAISAYYKNKYHMTFASPNDLNYSYEVTKKYLRKYRRTYSADMSKMAVQGFDVTLNYLAELLLEVEVGSLIMTDFETQQVGKGHGYENQKCYILQQSDFDIINPMIVNE